MVDRSAALITEDALGALRAAIAREREYMIATRRTIHQYPELGFQEVRTSAVIADELERLGMRVRRGVAGTGVVGQFDGEREGPTVLVRFDMDALPLRDATGTPYASLVPDVAHACGHDGHVAIGLGVARALTAMRSRLAGAARFVFQPAEELLSGAERMVREGILTDPIPDYALALHIWSAMPVGWLGTATGPLTAGGDSFEIRIKGKGGHGAYPRETRDPIVAAAHTVVALQSIVSRDLDAMEAGLVSVTRVKGGETFNVTPASVTLGGTVRAFDPVVRERILTRLREIAEQICLGLGCQAEVGTEALTRPVKNDAGVVGVVAGVAAELHPDAVIDTSFRTMASEDMAFLMDGPRGCYFYVGASDPTGTSGPHHSPEFDFDERALERGASIMTGALLALLR